MSTWNVAGTSSPLTEDVEDKVLTLLQTYWTETNPPWTDIEPGTGWGAGIKKTFAIHCTHFMTEINPLDVARKMHTFDTSVSIHVFQKRTANEKQVQLGNMIRQVEKILVQHKKDLGAGIQLVAPRRWFQADDPANFGETAYWHRVGECLVHYIMADSS